MSPYTHYGVLYALYPLCPSCRLHVSLLCFILSIRAPGALHGMICNLCKFEPREGEMGHHSRCCPLRGVESRRSLPSDNPFSLRGPFVSQYRVHRAQCQFCGLIGHTGKTLKLVPTRWAVLSTGQLVLAHNSPSLTKADFMCCFVSEDTVRLLLSRVYDGSM